MRDDQVAIELVSAEPVQAAWRDPKLANLLHHDWQTDSYDAKWSVSFDERGIDYARARFAHIAGTSGWPYSNSLELGCGTGFFTLNLMLGGVIESAHVSDLSPGMVQAAQRNARALGYEVQGRVADAQRLPYADDTFDVVVGHAVLHHLPDVELALRESLRVLKPGGRFVFAGEPSRYGDYVARRLARVTWWVTTRLTRLAPLAAWRRPAPERPASSIAAAVESVVDLHTFKPGELQRTAFRAGAIDVRVKTDELTAAWLGWPVRTFEHAVARDRLGPRWANFTYRSWKRLGALDSVLARVVPMGLFYNVEITGVKP